jgi:Polyketide cyclase / dehydrase and lipid transport
MKYFAWLMGLPLGSILFIWVSGLLLGPHYQVSAVILVEAPPEAIWKVLEEVESYPKWRRDIASIEITERRPDRVWWEKDITGSREKFCSRGSVYPNKWLALQEVSDESFSYHRIIVSVLEPPLFAIFKVG